MAFFGYRIFTDDGPLNDRIFPTRHEALVAAESLGLETWWGTHYEGAPARDWDVYAVYENGKMALQAVRGGPNQPPVGRDPERSRGSIAFADWPPPTRLGA
jgi:hypothetical protein